ncbi:O-antigen polymerase [Acinetobacter sp. UBA1297]|uniref:O-antigen polymerase n=1 Tax=Acinetobacter sp. UBA1297 TaxID=1945925 RepID=UPI002580EEBF|nr:O-antigen polymerase [Acinetobacter sp. UBA1297]
MFLISILALILGLSIYGIVGIKYTNEKKLFFFQFCYIFYYISIVPVLHIVYSITAPDLYYIDIKEAFLNLNIVNLITISFTILGFLLGNKVFKKDKIYTNKEKNINWNSIRTYGIIYCFGATIYLIYIILTGDYFYQESKSELIDSSISLIDYMIIESTPLIVAWVIISHLLIKKSKVFWPYFLLFFITALVFSGVRGSRIAVIFQLINFILLYSFLINKINFRKFLIFLIIGWCFNIVFSTYKYGGVEALKSYITAGERPTYLANKDSESLSFLVFDLGRSNIQAKILENYLQGDYKPPYFPSTYLNAINLLLPKDYRFPFDSKRVLGTEAQYGYKGDEDYSSSRIYGLLGESILNYGLYITFFVFFIYGLIHAYTLILINNIKNSKFILFVPLLFFIPIYFLFYDLDNIIFQVIKNWAFPTLIFILVSRLKS